MEAAATEGCQLLPELPEDGAVQAGALDVLQHFLCRELPRRVCPGDHRVPDDLRLTGLPRGLPAVSWHHFLPYLDVTREVQKYFKILL